MLARINELPESVKRSVKLKEAYPIWGTSNKMQNPSESNLSGFFVHLKKYVINMRLTKCFHAQNPHLAFSRNGYELIVL